MIRTLTLESFEPTELVEPEFVSLNEHRNRIRLERDPDFPPRPVAETRAVFLEAPAFYGRRCWWVRGPGGDVVASAFGNALDLDNNRHLIEVDLAVDPAHRRQGLGTALLEAVAEAAVQLDRRLLVTDTDSTVPSGEAFAEAIGAERGLEVVTNQVLLADLDLELLAAWRERGESRDGEFELAWFDGPYPDDVLDRMIELIKVMNDAPLDDLDVGDVDFDADQLRDIERSLAARHIERWVAAVFDRASGRAAGFTEVYWNPTIPHLIQQGDTGVQPEFRGHRLGRWMKAAMAERVLAERPQATCIRTTNAGSNAPMLAINRDMGFSVYKTETIWQIEAETVLLHLGAGATG